VLTLAPLVQPTLTAHWDQQAGISYTIDGDHGNTPEENARIPAIQDGVNRYFKSQEFHDYFCTPANGLDLNQTEGLSAENVIKKINSSTAHIVIKFYYSAFTRTIGYRNPGENIVYCNRKYHDGYSINDEISNVAHEFLHIIEVTAPLVGFQHDFQATPRRPFSVNYFANSAIESFKD
jgi:hypothetical protein